MESRQRIANRISAVTLAGNAVLFIFKMLIGIMTKSTAVISDAVHTFSDIFTTVLVVVGIRIAEKKEDEGHQYGHEKAEPIIATILSTILMITALGIGYKGVQAIFEVVRGDTSHEAPGLSAVIITALSIIFKESMYWYTVHGAKRIKSSSMLADAWHHRSDAFSSVGVLIGVIGARMGFYVLDPIMALVVCAIIIKVSVDIYKGAVNQLIDRSADNEEVLAIRGGIESIEGVKKIDVLKTRIHANRIYVDIEISVDGGLTLYEAHAIAENVHDHVEGHFENIKHCMVHVNPYTKEIDLV